MGFYLRDICQQVLFSCSKVPSKAKAMMARWQDGMGGQQQADDIKSTYTQPSTQRGKKCLGQQHQEERKKEKKEGPCVRGCGL